MPNLINYDAITRDLATFDRGEQGNRLTDANISRIKLSQVLKKIMRLKMEGLHLYKPLQHLEAFHKCRTKWAIIDGSNRSSKSQSAAAEVCRAWCGADPYNKYPRTEGNSLVVGQELDDIARLWRTCSESSFKMIRDDRTNAWRAVRPDPNNPHKLDPFDEAYVEKWRDAPPMIPPRLIANIAWENQGKKIPRVVTFTNGWKSLWRSSYGRPPQGDHYNLVHFDEQLENELFYAESDRGLVRLASDGDFAPHGIWSATSQTLNVQLDELREASEMRASYVTSFHTTIDQNPYVTDAGKREYYESLSEDDRKVRYFGISAMKSKMIYGMYDPMGVHGCEPFIIPDTWTRYLALDPGTDHCATTFYAIDPQNNRIYLYDAMDLRGAFSKDWAAEVKKRQGNCRFEAMVIDRQMGQQRTGNADDRIAQRFYRAVKDADIEPRQRGRWDGFIPGNNNVSAREDSLLGLLAARSSGPFEGTPRLQIFRGLSPELDKQIKRACNDPKNPNKRLKRKSSPSDLLETLEYMASYDPQYHPPEQIEDTTSNCVLDALRDKRYRQKQRAHGGQRKMVAPY